MLAKVVMTCSVEMFDVKFVQWLGKKSRLFLVGCSMSEDETVEILKGADVMIMGGNEIITPRVKENIPEKLKFIFVGIQAATAFPKTWEELKSRVYTTGGGQTAVAETTLRQLAVINPTLLQGRSAYKHQIPTDLETVCKDQTLLIVGAGTIGQKVMELAKGKFGRIIYTGGRGEKPELKERGLEYVPVDQAFKIANSVSIHLELNDGTKESVKEKQLLSLPEGAFVVDNARAWLISPGVIYGALIKRPDVRMLWDEFYVNGQEFLAAMDAKPNIYQQIISCYPRFIYTGHTASHGETTRKEYSEGARKILEELGLI